ncbi:MAG: ribosome maturation factor RimM [Candidatus Neomarinimicrobiota bacterium]
MEKKFAIARVSKPFGMRGGVRLAPLSRYCEDYISEKPIFLGDTEKSSTKIELIEKAKDGKQVRCVFKGIDSRDEAEAIKGKYVYASVKIDDEINQISGDLIGFTVVTDNGDIVGELIEILWLPVNDIYVIRNDEREILIPVIPEVIKSIYHSERAIEITPMDGLLN